MTNAIAGSEYLRWLDGIVYVPVVYATSFIVGCRSPDLERTSIALVLFLILDASSEQVLVRRR